ncbi:MAG: DUF6090 family protein [Bacteroidota bacterium]
METLGNSPDKWKKILMYAASEILFVLIGILLALQFNNWNFNRQQRESLRLHLSNLKEELVQEQTRLDHLKTIHEFKYEGFQYLLSLAGQPKYDPSIDGMSVPVLKDNTIWQQEIPSSYDQAFINTIFLWSHRVDMFKSSQIAFQEMNNLGTYSLIKNRDLKLGIINYYDLWEARLRPIMRELVEDWQKSLEKEGLITSTVYREKDAIALLRDNPERIGKLNRLARECVWWHNSAITLNKFSQQLVEMIDEEIEANK